MSEFNLTQDEKTILHNWHIFDQRIKNFKNHFTPFMAADIFGEDDGLRLFKHYRIDCDDNLDKFTTYLTKIQYDLLMVYILRNPRLQG